MNESRLEQIWKALPTSFYSGGSLDPTSIRSTPKSPTQPTLTMNIFRFFGDLSHLASIFILLHKIQTSRSCRGISFKTQVLYLVVFLTRYVDLVTGPYVSLYNAVMKLFFIGSTAYTLYLMRVVFRCVGTGDWLVWR